MFVTMLCYIVASLIYFMLSLFKPSSKSSDGDVVRLFAVAAILVRNIGATLASTLISFDAYKRNRSFEPHNPSLALKFLNDFEIATVTTLTWQYFAVYILDEKDEKD